MDLLETLDQAIATASVLCIVRAEGAENDMLCIPAARSDELLLVYAFYDFYPDGMKVMRIEDIYDAFREDSEIFFESILRAEGAYEKLGPPPKLNLSSWRAVIRTLRRSHDYCIIECEQEEDFLIGKIMDTGEDEFTFWYFDATGRWDDQLDVVEYEALTSLTFDDNYTNTIIKYIPRPN